MVYYILATTVLDDTLLYNATAFNGFIVNKEHNILFLY